MIRILTFSALFPSAAQPQFGVFVENRLRHLVASGRVEARVIAPVPRFPGFYAAQGKAPLEEVRHGLLVRHPRFLNIPRIGMAIQPDLLYRAGLKAAKRLIAEGYDFDLIDAHYFYPDGVAAARLSDALGKPFTVTARGTDINQIAELPGPRARILAAADKASGVITVCEALRERLIEMGADGAKIVTLRNGVDLKRFQPQDRTEARARWGMTGKTIVSVGYLIERKGHHLIVDALRSLPDVTLMIAGSGAMHDALLAQAAAAGVSDRVKLLGQLSQDQLPSLYAAADALVLASSREGWANVLLESMACGTPVVATRVWGTPECVAVPEAGRLCERTPESLAAEIGSLLADLPDRAATRRYAEGFSWDATTEGQIRLFSKIIGKGE